MKVASILFKDSKKPRFVGLELGYRGDGDTSTYTIFHHPLGMTRQTALVEEVTILKDYGEVVNQTRPTSAECKMCDAAELDFLKEHGPKPQPVCARLGIIAPNGDFYPCAYTCHGDLGSMLVTLHYPGEYRSYNMLERKGWLILKGGACLGFDHQETNKITQAAKDTFLKVVEAFELLEAENPDINWTKQLTDNPEGYATEFWSTEPGEAYGGETFAKAMRNTYDLYFGDYQAPEVGELKVPFRAARVRRVGEHPGD